ncbi:MAG: SpoIIE family protein phosphatase [Anaerolineales bacterium]|nr:SpoIIE family protein phosphatase [Anaerolineales bacterium]
MLPARLPRLSEVDIGAKLLAARAVGGDLYEVIRLDEDRLGFAIGDVSGKGIPAALYMALVSSLLRSEAKAGTAPADVVAHINQHLCERDMESMFVTLLYCDLDRRTRILRCVRAGHEHPMLWAGDAV